MEEKELKERFFERFFYAEDSSRDWDRWRKQDPSVVLEFILEELDKAREEGRREVIHKLKQEIDMAEMSKFIDAHQDFFNSFGESVLLKISKLKQSKE